MNPVALDSDSQSPTKTTVVRYSFNSEPLAREITVKVTRCIPDSESILKHNTKLYILMIKATFLAGWPWRHGACGVKCAPKRGKDLDSPHSIFNRCWSVSLCKNWFARSREGSRLHSVSGRRIIFSYPGFLQEVTKSHAALSSAVFEYQILRKGNAIINYECRDREMLPSHGAASGDGEPLIATLFITCPDSEGREL
jgi:hypothetical protein